MRYAIAVALLVLVAVPAVAKHTSDERKIYDELLATPGSIPEKEAMRRLGLKYGKTPAQVKEICRRVQVDVFSNVPATVAGAPVATPAPPAAPRIRAALEKMPNVRVESITEAFDFVGLVYVETRPALNDADVKRKVLEGLPDVLGALFSAPSVAKVQVSVKYSTGNGSALKAANVTVTRAEFRPGQAATTYPSLWVR
jgi:hypothetical protein